MNNTHLNVETEFDLMVTFQINLESKCTIVENALDDKHRYSLYKIVKPYPTYDEYVNGNDFETGKLIKNSSSKEELVLLQEERRNKV